ncbi:hypothetical protein M426DRAFT_316306 [Hypoxylon sp. CI-4A]|nr:hypothetical protein M426DRAFT_316306 [Hypoxylon sp. CI-4A]
MTSGSRSIGYLMSGSLPTIMTVGVTSGYKVTDYLRFILRLSAGVLPELVTLLTAVPISPT